MQTIFGLVPPRGGDIQLKIGLIILTKGVVQMRNG